MEWKKLIDTCYLFWSSSANVRGNALPKINVLVLDNQFYESKP